MKRYIVGGLAGLVVLVVGIAWYWPDGNVHLVVCDVGQGDGMLIWRGSAQVVVDGGPDKKKMIDCLSRFVPFWDRSIELVVLTHAEIDHLTGVLEILRRYQVGQLVTSNVAKGKVVVNEVPVHIAVAGEEIKVGPSTSSGSSLRFEILGARTDTSEVNEISVVLKLVYDQFMALLTGDIGSETETLLVNSGKNLRSNVLKVGHHGSKFSSSVAFLEAVRPAVAVISVGKNNYGHPTKEALERLKDAGARIWRTDESGDVEIVSDGQKMWVKSGLDR